MPSTQRMSRLLFLLSVTLLLCGLLCVDGREFQKGMAFGGDVATFPFDSAAAVQSLKDLKSIGANWVCIVATWFQDNINSTFIYPVDKVSPTISAVRSIINNATAMGFKVLLKPHVDVRDGTWRAWIGTYFTEEDWNIWFYSYEAFYLNFAKLAQETGCASYSVGVEMVTASKQSAKFIKLVSDVRQIYSGVVTYAANWGTKLQSVLPPVIAPKSELSAPWGGEIDEISWLNVLDIIGLDAYYFLTDKVDPSKKDLLLAWSPIVDHVRNISKTWNKTVLFTEIGYRSMEGSAVHPGWWNITAPVNVTQQALCYEAVFESLINETWWAGIHWWAWSTDPKAGGNNDTDFTPQGKKPTLAVLQNYYSILND